MRTVIIDDNEPTRKKIKTLLSLYTPEIDIIGEADGVETGFKCINNTKPELVLLDIEMGDGTGFDLLNLYKNPEFVVVFITAHDGYAIRAFQSSAIGYILKPIDSSNLIDTINKAKEQSTLLNNELTIQTLLKNTKSNKKLEKLILSDAENFYLIDISDVIRCESESNYTRFHLVDNQRILIAKTMKSYEEILEANGFFRVHRSHLINLNYFTRLDKKDGGTIFLKDGSDVPLATRRKNLLIEALSKL
ncbi:LytR/AlgR family response regulator transcription factor [Marivirga arenosa]|uniref:LytTR family DNA-binding domain-containing protein n=1 Tax=Marivirga arenosa TaxID=3059076 RepID=A0AA49JHR7_9BACT|nr:LytTR family DNA-binding domain-containing protein [Marivirga sp. BKB1-2]WKK82209.2 LytTR family DNA-binding domain-containing protein [Marivirga sp. BKB1-2]